MGTKTGNRPRNQLRLFMHDPVAGIGNGLKRQMINILIEPINHYGVPAATVPSLSRFANLGA